MFYSDFNQNNRVNLKKKINQIDPNPKIKNWIVKMLQIKFCEENIHSEAQSTMLVKKNKSTCGRKLY